MSDEKLPEVIIDLLDQAGDKVFDVLVEQNRINPEGMNALYGDLNDDH